MDDLQAKILTREEVAAVLNSLRFRLGRYPNKRLNLTIFRLSCCCGLRVGEIVGLNVGDFILQGQRPVLEIRKEITKGKHNVTPSNPTGKDQRKARRVPLWWDAGTLNDIRAWCELRLSRGAGRDDPFLVSGAKSGNVRRLLRSCAQKRWHTAIKVLGPERARQLSIHCGRHSFCSHSLWAGRSVVEVKNAAGHASLTTTSRYTHLLDRECVPDVFAFNSQDRTCATTARSRESSTSSR